MHQQCLAGATAALFGGYIQIFQEQTLFAQPGGVVEKINGETDRLPVYFTDQRADQGFGPEQAVANQFFGSRYFMFGFFVAGQFTHKVQD